MSATVTVKKDTIVIEIPRQSPAASKSGKSMVHATTNGNVATTAQIDGKPLHIGVNAYTKVD